MEVKEVYCRSALSKSNLPGIDYSLNPYKGCEHACLYCYVPSVLSISRERWGNFVEIRRNIPRVLAKELKKKKKGIIGISTVTDPYQPIERKYRLTRLCLEQISKHDFPVDIQTKSDLILRDLDVLKKFKDVNVGLTIPTLNDDERKVLEPRARPIKNRLDAIKRISIEGISTYIFFGPVYPSLNIEEIRDIIERFSETGVDLIIVDSLHLKKGVWNNLERNLPRDMMRVYRERLFNDKNYYSRIFKEVERWCRYYGINFEKAF